jgi:two-component system, response regulator, stage 0 sporulation protein F
VSSILIVDDQVGIRLLLNEIFQREGLTTYPASNGIEALQLFEQQQIDCILLDVKMPGMDGIEVLKKIREQNVHIPIFMMTAYGEQELIDQASVFKVEKFFTKPFNIFEVRDNVIRVLSME